MDYHYIYKILEIYLNEDILELRICSRLTWKNVVYYCKTNKSEYAIKIFKPIEDIEDRFEIEQYILKNGKKVFNIKTPTLIYECEYNKCKILIMEWINGKSIKKCIDETGLTNKNIQLLEKYIKDMEEIWSNNSEIVEILNLNKKNGISTIKNKIYVEPENVFDFCSKILKVSLAKIESSYYKILDNNRISVNNLINSDISLHEVILKGKNHYWIDFENFTLGNVNNDLAGIFYSVSNSIFKQKDEISKLLNVVSCNSYYNKETFVFYLIERVFSAYYLDYKNINSEEINFYINFFNNVLIK